MDKWGTCHLAWVDGRLHVEEADEFVRVSRELVAQAHPDGPLSLDGDLLTIRADRTVHYRLTDDGDPHSVGARMEAGHA